MRRWGSLFALDVKDTLGVDSEVPRFSVTGWVWGGMRSLLGFAIL